ncbi:[protein-PII] uridylyltransferase [Aestuariibacter sp. AA17]|uniref:Bifunctional uridylyltransferase/uridylyl-removing enzyme n=1 Tax=Fluctibacter corallii TaxID=2984329 RepID=A0ABT3A9J4_9ALTE|nr:[protein-PII] uridylyltransferase [Aestuariibacter sp. AA17]MCV2884986.1 [protein-PII] uridylyltransferase [Aestuariibacter sp. AA17]
MSLLSLKEQINALDDINDIQAFKSCIESSYQWLDSAFEHVLVDELVHGRATVVDALLQRAWHLLALDQVSDLALVAVGGYGRGQLQPHSDIDLLILSERALERSVEERITQFITLLWDIKLDVGQSVRTIKDTIKLAKEDVTIATNLIEARLLIGSEATFDTLQENVQSKRFWTSKDFFIAKYDEQKARHHKFHGTSYNLEPNLKENPGCLRDIQCIGWVAKKHFKVWNGRELVDYGYFTEQEWRELIECRSHLWRMRFCLHLEAGRSENRLLFDYQTDVAKRLGYGDEGKASVERMMKEFFRIVRRITELNDMLLQYFKQDILALKVKSETVINDDFELLDGLIATRNEHVFKHPESILRFLLLIADTPQVNGLHSSSIRQLRNARRQFSDEYYCNRPESRALFVALLRHPDFFGLGWDIMHRHGILQAYLPEWDHIVGMMQFDLFHAYTVDEHTHRLVKNVYRYHDPHSREFPRCRRIVKNLDKPELLYVAAIFHDIAKGRNGDHSKLGAVDVANFCESHGFTKHDSDLVSWLVENHLLMSVVAQRRDIYDPEVINDFAGAMRSNNHLNHLYALTLADIRATNDNLWNDWKASLLRELYLLTEKALDNGLQCKQTLRDRIIEHQMTAKAIVLDDGNISEQALDTFWSRLSDDYFARFKPAQLAWHAQVVLQNFPEDDASLIVALCNKTSKAGTELLVYGKDRPALFAQVASVIDSRNCTIHDAQIMSTQDGYVFDSFILLEQDGSQIISQSRLTSLQKAIETQLFKPGLEHKNRRKMSRQMKQLDVPTKVRFYSSQSNVTLLELEALDAPGLLAKISHLFVALNINLHMAKISTIGERAEDLFIVSNDKEQALSPDQQVALKKQLIELLDEQS